MIKQPATRKKQFGQSLVETALFLPILIILVAGVVEVSQFVITKNRVTNAARVSSRFAANGGEDEGMVIVTLNSITQTLNTDENRWDMWSIRATVNHAGNAFSGPGGEWSFEHTYGVSNTVLFVNVNEATIQAEILEQLRTDHHAAGNQSSIAADVRIVGSYILHDVDSILGLDSFPALANFSSVRALNIMREVGTMINQTDGCSAFPIGVKDEIRSVRESNYPETTPNNEFTYPNPVNYPGHPRSPLYTSYINHRPNKPLAEAQEGWLFKVEEGILFTWLRWNGQDNTASLASSLRWPGDSTNYSGAPFPGYSEPGDPTDQSMQIGDFIASSNEAPGSAPWGFSGANTVNQQLEDHILKKRTLRMPIWSNVSGSNYQISRFAVFRILGYQSNTNNGAPPWLLLEFIRWDRSCGQVIP